MSTSSDARSTWLVAGFRLAVLAFALHFGGVLHSAIDFVRTCEAVALHETDDCGDGEDHCPADCPNCHCSHGGAVALPGRAPAVDPIVPDAPIVAPQLAAVEVPPDSPPTSLFRPPRHHLS